MKTSQIILAQLDPSLITMMMGARNFYSANDDQTLGFTIAKGAKKKITRISITLNAMDTYDVTFGKIYKMEYKEVERIENVYADMLHAIIEETTGFSLKLPIIL